MNQVVRGPLRSSLGNQSVPNHLDDHAREAMREAAARKVEELFDILLVDHRNDHNTRETPARFAKMLVEETMRGRFAPPPRITDFDNVDQCQQLIVTGPIEVRSTCAHHLMPIFGHAVIGIVPSPEGRIIGLSKYDRIVDHFCARLQIQEELVKQIERFIVDETQPAGLAVRVSAVHMCKSHRGVRATRASRMVNTTYHGVLKDDAVLRGEFLQECAILERNP